jgi:hypothetical protein
LIDEKIVVVVRIIISRNDRHDSFIHLKKVFERERKEKKKKRTIMNAKQQNIVNYSNKLIKKET